jgi:SRSO17 transposase
VAPEIDVQAWVLDDTGFPKDGAHSPGVKRQYSGTLGKIGNCQIGVSVHAVGAKGTVPLGWALYLPEEWFEDSERRRKAKIPEEICFKTKPELGRELIERAGGWDIARAPILGDEAYGENTKLRQRLDAAGLEYDPHRPTTSRTGALSNPVQAPTQTAPRSTGQARLRTLRGSDIQCRAVRSAVGVFPGACAERFHRDRV